MFAGCIRFGILMIKIPIDILYILAKQIKRLSEYGREKMERVVADSLYPQGIGLLVPDHLISGPELPADESVRARFYGEA